MINDYYAVTHLDLTSASALRELSLIFKVYDSCSVSRLHLMLNYDPSVSVEFTLSLAKSYYNAIKPIIPKRLKISLLHTIPLVQGISTVAELTELAINISGRKYIYLTIPFDIKTDDAVSELHNLIYKRHLTPIIVAFEKLKFILPDNLIDSLYRIPNAVYQINLSSISSRETKNIVKDLVQSGKSVIFGSGTNFDACLYKNMNYYIKHIRSAVGDDKFAYFLLSHNKLFC